MSKTHSRDFVKAKKLMYVQRYEPINVVLRAKRNEKGKLISTAEIRFSDGKNTEKIVSGEWDFVMFAGSLHSSYGDGVKKLVEIRDTNRYYENMERFIFKTENDVKDAIKRLLEGKSSLPKGFNLEKAIHDVLDSRYEGEHVKALIENYFEVIAGQILILRRPHDILEGIKRKKNVNLGRFMDFFNTAGRVFQKGLFAYPPLKSVEIYRKIARLNPSHTVKDMNKIISDSQKIYEGLSLNGKRPVEGKLAMGILVNDYAGLFENCKGMLTELAIVAGYKHGERDMSEFHNVENILRKLGYGKLVNSIDKDLRHKGVHRKLDYDEKGKIKLIEDRSGRAAVIREIKYEELIDKMKKLRDLSIALILSISSMREIMLLRALDSPDLKFRIIENLN